MDWVTALDHHIPNMRAASLTWTFSLRCIRESHTAAVTQRQLEVQSRSRLLLTVHLTPAPLKDYTVLSPSASLASKCFSKLPCGIKQQQQIKF